jgi:hypothetical protein
MPARRSLGIGEPFAALEVPNTQYANHLSLTAGSFTWQVLVVID